MTDSRLATWDADTCARVHHATLEILADPGVDVHHEGACTLLADAGAQVDGMRVRFPTQLVDEALASAPRSFPLTSRGGGEPLLMQDGMVYFGTGGDCLYTLDAVSGERRLSLLSDVRSQAALAESLPNIDFVMSMALPNDVAETEIDVRVVAEMLRGTRKPLMICATCPPETLAILQRMAAVCGEPGSLIIYAMPSPPLALSDGAVGRIIACAELGIPLVFASGCAPGVTAPCSRAGMIVNSTADVLSGLVIHQLASPGAPFVFGGQHTQISMSTSTNLYGTPEIMALQQAGTEVGRFYGLPTFTFGGCSDAKLLDGQWAAEAAMTIVLAALTGSTLVHDVGYVESSFLGTHEAVVFGDELAGFVRAYLRGVSLDDLDAAVDEIRAVGPSGDHLGRAYTRKHYREFWQPSVLDQWMHDHWAADGQKTLVDRLRTKAAALRERPPAFVLEPDVEAELERLVNDGAPA
jgi:trimethylamine--corrinoid protein Co-methyltransferase